MEDLSEEVWKIIDVTEAPSAKQQEGAEKQREAAELLASVLWHLELACALGPLPEDKMQAARTNHSKNGGLPWQVWGSKRPEPSVTWENGSLSIRYGCEGSQDHLLYALHATLIGDAAIRLDSAREVLRPPEYNCKKKVENVPQVFWCRGTLGKELKRGEPKPIHIVVAFRDAYAHAESPTTKYKKNAENDLTQFLQFREKLHEQYSLKQVSDACLDVWQPLFDELKSPSLAS